MAKQINRLTARSVAALTTPGRHADGANLYLVVDKSGAKRWAFLFRRQGNLREMGLGGVSSVPLARACELAGHARAVVTDGRNPLEILREERTIPTFGEVAPS
jgi:Arm DNA-binding domain